MEISIRNLPPRVERYIEKTLAAGEYQTAEDLVRSLLARAAECGHEPSSSTPATRKSTRGILARDGVDISFDDIEQISADACKNFPRPFPKDS